MFIEKITDKPKEENNRIPNPTTWRVSQLTF
jgi:hypothetical protein